MEPSSESAKVENRRGLREDTGVGKLAGKKAPITGGDSVVDRPCCRQADCSRRCGRDYRPPAERRGRRTGHEEDARPGRKRTTLAFDLMVSLRAPWRSWCSRIILRVLARLGGDPEFR
jgi:hypothetical protein